MRTFVYFPVIFLLLLASLPLSASSRNSENHADSTFTEIPVTKVADDWLTIEDPAPQLSSDGRIPVIMVHGWSFNGEPAPPGTGYWNFHLNFLLNDPELSSYFKPYYVKYWSNAITVNELGGLLRDKIQLAGLHEKPFVLIAHSMGGLVSRSFMNEHVFTTGKYAGTTCGELAKLLITLGTPHHGSPMANGPARDEHVSFFLRLYMSAIESMVFSETKYNEVNRSDLHWDNYDNLLNYTKYPAERNDWLTNLNSNTQFDAKLICYAATVTGEFLLPPYNTTNEQYKVGAYVMYESFGFDNDGIVPYQSAIFEGHSPKKIRFFEEYNHTDIAKGKGEETILFTSVKQDFLEVVPPQLIWPSEASINLKHSEKKEIRWKAPSTTQTVNLYFSGDNGITFSSVAENVNATLGSYQWSVPDTNLTQCIIRVTNANDESLYTQTENPFTIYHNRLTFQSPLARSYFVPNKTNPIRWSQTGLASTVTISYTDPKNGIEKVITESHPANQLSNSYSWELDHSLPPTDSACIIIKMTGMDSIGDAEDYSFISQPFMMLDIPKITVTSPSSNPTDVDGIMGEKMEIGSTHTVRWETEGEIKFVKISLCDSSKNVIQEIRKKNHIPGIHSAGSFSWKVPEIYGNNFYLLLEAGVNESTITATGYTLYPFRVNQQFVITDPENSSNHVKLLPCITAEAIEGATAYHFEITDSATSGLKYSNTYTSTEPEICVPPSIENELLAGTAYKLTSWAIFDTIKSYISKIGFHTEATPPGQFQTLWPVTGDTLWDDTVSFSWNHAIGATSYRLELIHQNKIIVTEELGRADTAITFNMNKKGYADTIYWRITALNDVGETTISNYFFNKDHVGTTLLNNNHSFGLACYPNPVNDVATIEFMLEEKVFGQHVSLTIYNLSGQQIEVLLDENLDGGKHRAEWIPARSSIEKGIYFPVLNVDGIKEVMKISIE
jgi:triacylglycerol esterase/lipase EstA (alpha/beta hydrolase family)